MRVPRLAARVVTALSYLACFAASRGAEAAPALAEQCATASERAQLLRLEGHLLAARADLVTCSASGCPSVVRKDCDRWLSEVDDAIPSTVVTVRDANGGDVVGARMVIDGTRAEGGVDARAIPLDPGTHEIEVFGLDGTSAKRSIVLREGEKRRPLEIVLARADAPPVTPRAKPAPIVVARIAGWSLIGLGGVGVATGIFFGIRQHVLYQDALDTCSPACSTSETEAIDQSRLIEGIALSAGAIAIAAGVILLITHPRESALRLDLTRVRF